MNVSPLLGQRAVGEADRSSRYNVPYPAGNPGTERRLDLHRYPTDVPSWVKGRRHF
jgi:hypothetical protein